MTEGHRLAIDQLRAIQDNAKGAFEVVEIAEEATMLDGCTLISASIARQRCVPNVESG